MDEVVVLGRKAVADLLPMADCLGVVEQALRRCSVGDVEQPVRTKLGARNGEAFLGWMPGYLDEPRTLGIKVVTVFPDNLSRDLPSHRGLVLLFDPDDGALKGVFDGGEITAVRTAAASGVATRLLARENANVLAVLGYGEQARRHVEAMCLVRPIKRLLVWGRDTARAAALATRCAELHGVEASAAGDVASAVAEADIICTTTAAREPVLFGEMLPAGCHVNVVGSSFPTDRELDDEAVRRASMFVDYRPMTEALGAEYRSALASGAIGAGHLRGELGELLEGRIAGRCAVHEITLFKSLGVAAEDLASAAFLLHRATGLGADPRVQRVRL